MYQPPTTYQDANPYQNTNDENQISTYSQRASTNRTSDNLFMQPTQASYSRTEDFDLVDGDDNDNVEIDPNIPDDE